MISVRSNGTGKHHLLTAIQVSEMTNRIAPIAENIFLQGMASLERLKQASERQAMIISSRLYPGTR